MALSSDDRARGLGSEDGAGSPMLTRRRLLAGGGLLFGAMLMQACGGKKAHVALPDPIAPSENKALVLDGWNAPSFSLDQLAPVPAPVPAETMLPVGVIPRGGWTRAGVARPREIYDICGINRITIHHDGMRPAYVPTQGDVAARIEQIRQAHVWSRGWADIGYHYVIDPAGRVWEARNIRWQGAHVKDQNEHNLGILVMGNFEVQQPTVAQLSSLDRFVAQQMMRYSVPMWRVRSHRELAQTACPGRNLQSYLVRSRASGGGMARMGQA